MANNNDTDFYDKVFPVPERVREKSYIKSRAEYEKLYKESIENPDAFWAREAEKRLTWFKPFDKNKVSDWSFDGDLHVKWFEGGKLNVSYNCLDRHLETKKNKAAIIFEGNDPKDWKVFTYYDVYRYTSGSTGKPKGALHTTAGYLLYASMTQQLAFDVRDEDVYWCTADIGWVTGHSYVVYGPLTNGHTSILFEGVPSYPGFDRFWQVVEKYNVNNFYTAPTAIRAVAKEGDEWVEKRDLSSLRLLGSVGEPLNPEAWWWLYNKVGGGKCTIADTWWQTETGGHMILPLPGAIDIKPAKCMVPFFGTVPAILDEDGKEVKGPGKGALCLKTAWPGMMRGVFGNPELFKENYFSQFPGYYFSGDGAERDADGDYKITGRVDDVINVSRS